MKKIATFIVAIMVMVVPILGNAQMQKKEFTKELRDSLEKIAVPLSQLKQLKLITLIPYFLNPTQSTINHQLDILGAPSNIQSLAWSRYGKNVNRDSITSAFYVTLGQTSGTASWDLQNLETEFPDGGKYFVRDFIWYDGIPPYYIDTVFYTALPTAVTSMNIYNRFFLSSSKVRLFTICGNNDPGASYLIMDVATGLPLMAQAETLATGNNFAKSIDVDGFTAGQTYTVRANLFNADTAGISNDFTFTMEAPLGIESVNASTKFEAFPNPAKVGQIITVVFEKKGQLNVFNAIGQMTLSESSSDPSGRQTVETSLLLSGIYLFEVKFDEGGRSKVRKIVIY